MNWVDLVVLVLAVAYAIAGFRHGLFVGLFSLVGFFAGAAIGLQVAQSLGRLVTSGNAQVWFAVLLVVVLAVGGQALGAWLGAEVRERITWEPARLVGSIAGAALGVIAVLVVSWMIAVPLASSPYPQLSSAVRHSEVIRSVDGVMPSPMRSVYSSLRGFVNRSGFPAVLGDLQATRIIDVAPPDAALVNSPEVRNAHHSVVKIYGAAPSCDRNIEGSGFVISPEHVLTNAHVVAGTSALTVTTSDGQLDAKVVVFDPDRDIAVLDVPGLQADPLRLADRPAATGTDAIVLGYPEDGPFDARAARIRSRETITGRDIYDRHNVTREIYAIRGLVRSGNSGGPLIDKSGAVLGVVFATALDSSDTGFVLTKAEAAPDIAAGRTATSRVDTGGCSS